MKNTNDKESISLDKDVLEFFKEMNRQKFLKDSLVYDKELKNASIMTATKCPTGDLRNAEITAAVKTEALNSLHDLWQQVDKRDYSPLIFDEHGFAAKKIVNRMKIARVTT